jgi:hypothetical protein
MLQIVYGKKKECGYLEIVIDYKAEYWRVF